MLTNLVQTDQTPDKIQPVARGNLKPKTAAETAETPTPDAFEQVMRAVLTPNSSNEVSEEELFAAMIQERVSSVKGEAGLKQYQELFEKEKMQRKYSDGSVQMEAAARGALRNMLKAGGLTTEEADQIHSEAFAAAQLDDNKDQLFDGKGGPNDPTRAVATMESALVGARAMVEQVLASSTTVPVKPLKDRYNANGVHGSSSAAGADSSDFTASGESMSASPVDGPSGFLYKPESDSEGKLVVLLPESLTGKVDSVVIKDPEDKEIESGRYGGVGNGGREHFRFKRAGGDYPDGLKVEIRMQDGSTRMYMIEDSSERYD